MNDRRNVFNFECFVLLNFLFILVTAFFLECRVSKCCCFNVFAISLIELANCHLCSHVYFSIRKIKYIRMLVSGFTSICSSAEFFFYIIFFKHNFLNLGVEILAPKSGNRVIFGLYYPLTWVP